MTRRFCQRAYLKKDKIEEYRTLHANVWPLVLKTIEECNLKDYRIFLLGDLVVSVFDYTGEDYEADMKKMASDPVTQEWWTHTKPCFEHHEEGVYYEDMDEIFNFPGV